MLIARVLLNPLLEPVKRNFKFCLTLAYNINKTTSNIHLIPCRTFAVKGRHDYETDNYKSDLISELKLYSSEDAEPFRKLPLRTLLHIHKVTKNDQNKGYCQNRLYFIAEKLQCKPSHLSQKLAQRSFVYSLPFDWLENSLNILIEFRVSADRILRDLWVLKYHSETIRQRLQRTKDAGIDVLFPWMVRCSEDILQRYIKLTTDTKHILKEVKSTQVYLATRLKTSPEHIEDMYNKIPALKTIRVTKVKSFLDFLEKEGFQLEDIASKVRVLTASQKTVEQRLDRLRKLGLTSINLNVLCRSRKDFNRYLEPFESGREENLKNKKS